MLRKLAFLFFLISILIIAQETDPTKIDIPTGFNWLYLIFFALGMVIHYGYKVYTVVGTVNYFKNFLKNLFGWFINKFHWTLIASGATAIIAFAVQYGLPQEFATINFIGIGISIVAGYIGDIANQGNIVPVQ